MRPGSVLRADRWFFPLAAGFATAAVPLWLLQYAGILSPLPEAAGWHGHEMLFGFALAVVAGFLLARPSRAGLGLALTAWIAGRAAPLLPLPEPLPALLALAFPATLLGLAGRPLLGAAKTGRNRVFGLVIGGFFLAELIYQAGRLGLLADGATLGVAVALDLVLLLLFAMGGRVLAPAASGALQGQGRHLSGLAQPRIERAGLIAFLAMLAATALGRPDLEAAAAFVAGLLVLLRLLGWRVWRIAGEATLAPLLCGYAMLGLGLLLYGPAVWSGLAAPVAARHLAAIGGLGGIAFAMMMRVAAQRDRRPLRPPRGALAGSAMIFVAASARFLADASPAGLPALVVAAALWSGVFGALAVHLATGRRQACEPAQAEATATKPDSGS